MNLLVKSWGNILIWAYVLLFGGVHFSLCVTSVWGRTKSQETAHVKDDPREAVGESRKKADLGSPVWSSSSIIRNTFFESPQQEELCPFWATDIYLSVVGCFCSVYVVLFSLFIVCCFKFMDTLNLSMLFTSLICLLLLFLSFFIFR